MSVSNQCVKQRECFREAADCQFPVVRTRISKWDLLHTNVKVVVVLDSASTLGDIEVYRRNSREDILLQKNGYRVLRFLVEDVCGHLDYVLDAIVANV